MKSKLREALKAHRSQAATAKEGRRAFANELIEFIEDGTVRSEDVSLRELFDILVVDAAREDRGLDFDPTYSDLSLVHEEMLSSNFPTITGKLFHQTLIQAYEPASTDIRSLFLQTTSKHREETVVGLTAGNRGRHVEEGMPYPESQVGEKRCLITNHKFGEYTALTAEAVLFDQTGELLGAARARGTYLADLLEEFACYRLQDAAWTVIDEGTSQAFVYGGTRYALYQSDHSSIDSQTNDNLIQSGTGSAPSITSVEASLNLLAQMKDEKGNPIRVRPTTVFCHEIVGPSVKRFFNYQDFDIDSAERNVNPYKNSVKVFTSPFFPDTAGWYYGDPSRMFRMQWVWQPKTEQLPGDPRRDVLMGFQSSMYVGIGATDYRQVVYNYGS